MLSAFASVEPETKLVAAEVATPSVSAVVGQEMPTVGTRCCLVVGASAEQLVTGPQSVCWFVAAGD